MLTLDASAISKAIREKKKKMAESAPEMVGTSPTPDMNAQDVYDVGQKARIEETLDSPDKINADQTMMDEPYTGVGLSPEDMKRMGRLRAFMDKLDI